MGISWICQPSKCFLWLCSSVEVSQSYSIRHSWDSLDFTQDDPDKIVYIVWLHRRKASTESRTQWKANEFNSRLMRPFSFPTNFEASLWTSILFGDSVISGVRGRQRGARPDEGSLSWGEWQSRSGVAAWSGTRSEEESYKSWERERVSTRRRGWCGGARIGECQREGCDCWAGGRGRDRECVNDRARRKTEARGPPPNPQRQSPAKTVVPKLVCLKSESLLKSRSPASPTPAESESLKESLRICHKLPGRMRV